MAYLPDSEDHLRAIIAEAVRSAVPEAVAAGVRRALQKEYLTTAEVCEMTGWSRRKLAYLRSKRAIPFVQRGRSILYPTREIEAFLLEGYVPAQRG